MEGMTACRQRVEALRRQAGEQIDALAAMKEVFAQEAEHLRRHDQARCLHGLRAEVMQEVEQIQRIESAAGYGFDKAMLTTGLVKFALGAFAAAVAGSREDPLSVGAKLAASDFGRTAPFGTVVVAVGSGGVPDDVEVVPLSRYARELGRPEAEIEAALEARGYLLMAPQTFSKVLDELEDKVLRGILTLPVATASFLLKPADGGSG